IQRLAEAGAEGAILGCTEIPLLIKPTDVTIPTFNTTKIHAEQAVAWALVGKMVR
ncbi:MAG: aspartate racemase, partial [Saprospiraceae bacterium]